jgi:PAS domain S-box-containing protein/putative nucleotidyltransferase with HDIG domain
MTEPHEKGKPVSILLIEDNPGDARLIKQLLFENKQASFRIDIADRLSQGMDRAEKNHYQAVLLDLGLPDSRGINTFTKLNMAFKHLPIVVLSGLDDESTALTAVQEGAQDYLVKGQVDGHTLWRSIRYSIERKRAEQELRSKQLMLARTEGVAHVGSWEWDIATDMVTWSEELFRIFQRDHQEGAPSFAEHPALYHPDDMARLQQAVEVAITNGTPYELELRAIRKDGETRVCMARGVADMASGGRAVRLFGSLQDITERKQKDEALKASEAQYRWLSEHITDGVWLLDMNLKPIYQSPSMEKLTGFTHQELMELSFEKRITPESLKLASELYLELMPGIMTDPDYSPTRVLELEYYTKGGTTLWTENKLSGIRDENGNPLSILAEVRDITERKLAEEKLTKSYESMKKTLNNAINTMVKIVEMRDPYTAGHQQKVAELATKIAGELKLDDTRIEQLRMASAIHDIGKMYIPSDILSKPGRLSEMEFSLIKTHAQNGYDIVRGMDFPGVVAQAVLQHHERLDGSGYPNQLKGEDTLLEAKILAVADVIEAMSSHRPYRPALGLDKALIEIEQNSGKLYDQSVVDVCTRLFREKSFSFEQQAV